LRGKPESEVLAVAKREAQTLFNLRQGPLYRATLLQLANDDFLLSLTMHHIVTDGWSIGVFRKELGALYEAYRVGLSSPLPELRLQYADFAAWQRAFLQGDELSKQLAHWKAKLQDIPMLELPTDRPRPAVRTFAGARHYFDLPTEVGGGLRELSRAEDATLFIIMLSAFMVLLSHYSGQQDFGVGTVVAGRTQPEVQNLMGFFVNTLALRADVSGNPT